MRWWLVVATVGVLSGTAIAKREPACTCRAAVTLPRQGATDVPTNARFWTIPATGITDTPDQPIQRYELAAHTAYELNAQQLSFTTGAGRDDTPPTSPGVGSLSIDLAPGAFNGRRTVAGMHISGMFDDDTAIVRITITDGDQRVVYYTTPHAMSVCDPGFTLSGKDVDVQIVAIDLAGNESAPAVAYAEPLEEAYYRPTCHDEHHTRCGTPLVALIYLGPVIGLVAIILLVVVIAVRSSRSRAHSEAEPLAIASALYLARAVRLRAHVWLGVVLGSMAIATVDDGALVLAFFASPILVWLAIRSVARWAQASRFLRLLGYDGVSAEVHGDRVTIVVGGKVAFLRASPKLVDNAKRNALPTARL